MPLKTTGRLRPKGPPPGETGQEVAYLRFLSEKQVPVTVKLRDGETVHGWIEYFDDRMIRLTREGKPNLFIYKNQIRVITESLRHIEARRRERTRNGAGLLPSKPQTVPPITSVAGVAPIVSETGTPQSAALPVRSAPPPGSADKPAPSRAVSHNHHQDEPSSS